MSNTFVHCEPENAFPVSNPRVFIVMPRVPERLSKLLDVAYNLWWVWNSEAFELFRRIDRDLWEEVHHNPIKLLGEISEERLKELEQDTSFLSHLDTVYNELNKYLSQETWFHKEFSNMHPNCKIAYFSMEHGIAECLQTYSGGLGVLAGDMFKSSSDMGVPMVGIGLIYRYGYFVQHLTEDGWQTEEYQENHFFRLPIHRLQDAERKTLKLYIELPKFSGNPQESIRKDEKEKIYFEVWEVKIGRNSLFLLSTDIGENTSTNRTITYNLYGGDRENRIRQEILLAFGGVKLLKHLNINPTVWHMNEGHSTFVILARIYELMKEQKLSFEEAKEFVTQTSVFTTHTPVPSGIDVFDVSLMTKYFSSYCKDLGIDIDTLLALGRENEKDKSSGFSMAVLGIRCSKFVNAVSKLHGETSRNMWKHLFPNLPRYEIPIVSITNGVHINTWVSNEFATLFDRYIGPVWKEEPENQNVWERIKNIPDAELWRSHERRRERLVAFVRYRLKQTLIRRGAPKTELDRVEQVLDPEALTIGFARRFVEYKRAFLLFRDISRLKKIVNNKERPVQIIISGKAHPYDNVGKEIIKYIIQVIRDPELRDRIVFVEDYDLIVAHYMVQGCDIWLNLPRRPLEASGTSGMKAAVNGVLHVSTLDGWWCEGYNGENGWVVGSGEVYQDTNLQDEIESRILYDLLEKEIIPLFYTRGIDGVPREWVKRMKNSMISTAAKFNTNRLIEDYTRQFYIPADDNFNFYSKNNFEQTKKFSSWYKKVCSCWDKIKILENKDNIKESFQLKDKIVVETKVYLDELTPEDVSIQLYYGYLDSKQRILEPKITIMETEGQDSDKIYKYRGEFETERVGHCGYVIRCLPKFKNEVLYRPNLIKWL